LDDFDDFDAFLDGVGPAPAPAAGAPAPSATTSDFDDEFDKMFD
jgi:hypothetical protein